MSSAYTLSELYLRTTNCYFTTYFRILMGVTFINIPHTQHVITGVTNSLIKHSERVEVAQKASGEFNVVSPGVALAHNVLRLCEEADCEVQFFF